MPKYFVTIERVQTCCVEVTAKNEDEAEKKALFEYDGPLDWETSKRSEEVVEVEVL